MKDLLFTTAAPYLIRMMMVSGLFLGYYRLFLRDRVFHRYNRFYLLGASLAAMILPLIRFRLPAAIPLIGRAPALALHVITPGAWNETSGMAGPATPGLSALGSAALICTGIYCLAVLICLLVFLRQLLHIRRLNTRYPLERMGPIEFYMTREPGTPFSFLNRLFWNEEIDMDSQRGRQIFLHEWFHIRQRHTLDLLWLRTVMAFFWINPFFYLIYREIRMIHEYLADQYAVAGGDRYDYAEGLVWHTVSGRSLSLLHPFFQSSIKRRITMLTKFNVSRPGYLSRMMVLPLTFLLLCAFALRKSAAIANPAATTNPAAIANPAATTNPAATSGAALFTVVIDAGHGGSDDGAVWGDVKEKDLDLALALKIEQLAPQVHLNVVLTRKTDELAGGKSTIHESLEYRATLARDSRADLFVSLHVNNSGGGTPQHGFEAFVSPENAHAALSEKAASALIEAVRPTYTADQNLHRPTQGVYVLEQTAMPAVLLECGSIDNPADLAFIRDARNQEEIARDILHGIQNYQETQAASTPPRNDPGGPAIRQRQ